MAASCMAERREFRQQPVPAPGTVISPVNKHEARQALSFHVSSPFPDFHSQRCQMWPEKITSLSR
jgi:hypothetical protein